MRECLTNQKRIKTMSKEKKKLLDRLEKLNQDLKKATDKKRIVLIEQSIKDCQNILRKTKD